MPDGPRRAPPLWPTLAVMTVPLLESAADEHPQWLLTRLFSDPENCRISSHVENSRLGAISEPSLASGKSTLGWRSWRGFAAPAARGEGGCAGACAAGRRAARSPRDSARRRGGALGRPRVLRISPGFTPHGTLKCLVRSKSLTMAHIF